MSAGGRVYLEGAKTVSLVALVGLSLFLSGQVWMSAPVRSRPVGSYQVPFVAAGARSDVQWQRLVQPEMLVVHLGSEHRLVAPGDDLLFPHVWNVLTELASRTSGRELQALETGIVARLRAGRGETVGAEAVLPGSTALGIWRRLWAEMPGSGAASGDAAVAGPAGGFAGEPVDRLAVFVNPSSAWIVFRTEGGYVGTRLEGEGRQGQPAPAELARTLPDLIALAAGTSLPVVTTIHATETVRVLDGVFAPTPPLSPPLARLLPADLPGDRLARSFFPDLTLARKVSTSGLRLYTDGTASLTIRFDDATADYQRPAALDGLPPVAGGGEEPGGEARPAPASPGVVAALRQAVEFTSRHGGWPQDAFLADVRALHRRGALRRLGGRTDLLGYRFVFALRWEGLPVAGVEAVRADVGAGGIGAWRRRFLRNVLSDRVELAADPPQKAVEAAGALTAARLPPSSRVLREVRLVYALEEDGFAKPTWLLVMRDQTRVWLDASGVENHWLTRPQR